MPRLFGTDGIRDRAGQGLLSPAAVARLALAVGGLLRQRPERFRAPVPRRFKNLRPPTRRRTAGVLIGRDTRASGLEIDIALAEGFRAAGVGVLRAGVLTTPGVACLTRTWGCPLGVVVSASHNPASDNGIKFISPEGFKIPDAAERAIEARVAAKAPRRPVRPRAAPVVDFSGHASDYLDFLARFCRPLRGLRVAADCAHGAASRFAGPLLERLGARPYLMNAAPDGRNINEGCGALHPEKVAAAVRRLKADVGVAFDGDADRAILVDERGEIRDGDHVLALCALHLKKKGKLKGNMVVSTVMANFGLERLLAGNGIALRRTAVGDKFVAAEMLRAGAVLGGEPSGHVLFFDAAPAGDGLLTTLRVLDILAERGGPLSRLTGVLSKCPQVLLNVAVTRRPPLETVGRVRRETEAARAALRGGGRILVRYSGTEPLCRVMVEGNDGALVRRLARRVADAVRKELA